MKRHPVTGVGLGLRRDFLDDFLLNPPEIVDFIEVAPENWMTLGGELGEKFAEIATRHSVTLHGLSLSLGGPEKLDEYFLHRVKHFMDKHHINLYTEHLSYCSDTGHLYDLMPIPFTQDAIAHVVDRIKKVQDVTGNQFAIENVSYYAAPMQQMAEIEFINGILEKSDCQLLLDVNNIYVNSINHGYDALDFLKQLPCERIAYCHIAGHYEEDADLIIDTHGADVVSSVWNLLSEAYQLFGVFPTLLERDFNIPPLNELIDELQQIKRHMTQAKTNQYVA
ncbi:MAG: DUF692 domain-containing protein [Methylococcales bacterium]|jgi:uncharacterized protein (UPF0276 family)|nr:DUF692 domain-containing protein [Methylococcales bacterium]MBT7409393.1 DUF692 domain-containing protein [Methylococcales bacterium]